MTITQIIDAARSNLNALSDTFWTDAEILKNLYLCELELARKTRCIENTSTQSSVSGTATYSKPTASIDIWRVTYNGTKLQLIDQRQFDSIYPDNTTVSSGTPVYYSFYEDTYTLYPTPGTSSLTIKTWSYDEPTYLSSSAQTLDVPSVYHDTLLDGLTSRMAQKDVGHPAALYWAERWEKGILDVLAHVKRKRRADRFAIVKTEEQNLATEFGII